MPFVKKPQVNMNGYGIGYWEYLPANFNGALPVIIAFHGIGEAGDGSSLALDRLLANGVPKLINEQGFPYNAVVICPQYAGSMMGLYQFNALVDYVKATYKTDKVLLTGLSGGANSITEWMADKNNPSKIVAAQLVCIVYSYQANIGLNYAKIPTSWYVGEKDERGSFPMTKAWVQGITDFGGNVVMKSWPNEYHSVYNTVYQYTGKYIDNKDWAEWLLSKLSATQPPPSGNIEAEFSYPGGKYTLFTDKTWTK